MGEDPSMRYQLILQFEADSIVDFDQLVALENKLIEDLGNVVTADGHDFGSGEFNIFVVTDEPLAAFREAHSIITRHGVRNVMRSAYRELTDEKYVILWPPSLTEFHVS